MQEICCINQLINKISNYYGYNLISSDAILHCADLISAINKHYHFVNSLPFVDCKTLSTERCDVIESLAEIQLVVWELIELLNCGSELNEVILNKLQNESDSIDESEGYVL